MAEQENDEAAAVEETEISQDVQETAYPVLNGFLDDLNNPEGKTIQLNPETGEGIITNIETGETRSGFVAELVADIYDGEDVPQASANTDGFVTLVENGELDVEVTSSIIEQGVREIIPELNENVTIEQVNDAENPSVTAASNASTLAADDALSGVRNIDGDVESVKPFLAETHAKMLENAGSVEELIAGAQLSYGAAVESGQIPQAIADKEIELLQAAGNDSNAYAEARFASNDFFAEQAVSMGIDPETINDYTIVVDNVSVATTGVDPVEEQARRDTDARVVREAMESDAQQAAMGEMNLMAFFEILIAMISGDQDAIADLMEKFGNNGQDNTPAQDNATPSQGDNAPEEVAQDPTPQAEQEEPSPAQDDDAPTQVAQEPTPEVDQEAVPATQENDEPAAPVPEDDNGGPTEIAQGEPQGYVNEGLGPLLTEVNKPADELVSPLIASAMQDDVPQNTSILGSIFSANAGNEVGNENVIQVPFAPEALVADPQAQPMEVAVTEPAVNDEEFTQSEPAAMKLG